MHHPNIPIEQNNPLQSPLSPSLVQNRTLEGIIVFNIPELVFRICSFLNRQELFIITQLSKHFNSLCCPILYRHIDISTPFQFYRFFSNYTQHALFRYSIHIKSLSTRYYTLLKHLLHPNINCQNLIRLEFPATLRYTDPDIPREFYSNDGEPFVNTSTSLPHAQTISYNQDEISYIVQRNMLMAENPGATTGAAIATPRYPRSFELFDKSLLILMIDKCPNLSELIVAKFPFDHDDLIYQIADRMALRSQDHSSTTTTTTTTTTATSAMTTLNLISPPRFAPTRSIGKGLKKLELTNLHLCKLRVKPIQYLLDHCTPDLEELVLSISFGSKAEVNDDEESFLDTAPDNTKSENSDNSHRQIWNLRRLILKGNLSGQGPLIWLPLLQKCRWLQTLSVDVYELSTMTLLAHTLQTCCPDVSDITLQCMTGPQQDSDIAELIQSSQSWKSLSMSFFHGFGPLSTSALVKHSLTLKYIVLEECDGLDSEDIQTMLKTCSQLKVFRVMTSNGAAFNSTMYLDAEDMTNSPWACNGLVNLKLMIAGIPRPDLQTDQYGNKLLGPLHDGTITGYECQRAVYQQLGRLKSLQELWLGHDKPDLDDEENYFPTEVEGQWKFIDPDEQFECLEFSLRSGLDELCGLKELRVLNVDRMNVRIGLSEVQWMVRNWPKLEKIIGLVVQGENPSKCVQWLYDNRPDIELPSVLGNFYTSF